MVMWSDNSSQHPLLRGTQAAIDNGYAQVYYDVNSGQMVRTNPTYGYGSMEPQYLPVNGGGLQPGPTTYAPPAVDFNSLPRQAVAQAQPYVRPNAPAQNTGSGYRPQFDPTFIQQMLAQRFGAPQAGIPTVAKPSLTPGATQSYGGYQGPGGLAALRGIAGPAPSAPAAPMGGTPNAPV